MNAKVASWNQADASSALDAMLACCCAYRWAERMVALRPIESIVALSDAADREWAAMEEPDWLEAFACHPRIGEREASHASNKSAAWSKREQSQVESADDQVLAELAARNVEYEQRFGLTYIVCATGKSAAEMLAILKRRLGNNRATELREAAEQQRQITQIRLGKWLVE